MIGLLNVILLIWSVVVIICAWKPKIVPLSLIVSFIGFTLCMGILALLYQLS